MEQMAAQLEGMSVEDMNNLPNSRFMKDMHQDLVAAGISADDAARIVMQADLNLSSYDSNNEDFIKIRQIFVRITLLGRDKIARTFPSAPWVSFVKLKLKV